MKQTHDALGLTSEDWQYLVELSPKHHRSAVANLNANVYESTLDEEKVLAALNEEVDLFEHYEALPQEVQEIIEAFGNDDNTYEACEALLAALKPHGYTFEYGLDAEPYNLKKIQT